MSWAVRAGCGVRHPGGLQAYGKHGLSPHGTSRGLQDRLGGPPQTRARSAAYAGTPLAAGVFLGLPPLFPFSRAALDLAALLT